MKLKDIQKEEKEETVMYSARVKPSTKRFLQSQKIDLDKVVNFITKEYAKRGKSE